MRFDFGDFALDTDRRELTRGAERIPIGPKVFDLLVYLVKNRDRVVTKDELLDAVWDGRIVSESTLASHVNAVRKAIDDTGAERKFVRTLARKGFRFVGEIVPGQPPIDAIQSKLSSGAIGEPDRAPTLPDRPSIAVLPFDNMSGDPEQEYFSDGITEDLITDLAKISGLFVVARNSSFAYKGRPADIRKVADELDVRYVAQGSVRKAAGRIRVTARLVDPSTGYHLWAERYDRNTTDIFALQDEITEKIVSALEVTLSKREQEKVARRYTNNLEAYDNFLRGRDQVRATNETNAQAQEMFKKAIELDPGFAAAYAMLSYTNWREWFNQWTDDPYSLDHALETAQKAVALDDGLPLARVFLAWVYVMRNKHDRAITEGRRAIALDPNLAEAYAYLGEIMNLAGKPEEGIHLIGTAMRLDPHFPPNYLIYLGHAYWATRQHEEAMAFLKRCVTRLPGALSPHRALAVIYSELDRKEEARAEVAEMLKISPRVNLTGQKERLPFKSEATSRRYLNGLRAAGLPE